MAKQLYFRSSAKTEIEAINDRLTDANYTEHLKRALNLLSDTINDLLLGGKIAFPLFAPDGGQFNPQYSFENEQTLGIYRDPISGLVFVRSLRAGQSLGADLVGVLVNVTPLDTLAFDQTAFKVLLNAGYTGANTTVAAQAINSNAGTEAIIQSGLTGNVGVLGESLATTAGDNTGISGYAENAGSGRAIGVHGAAPFDAGQNIGVVGVGGSTVSSIGGYFVLRPGTNQPPAISASLVADDPSAHGFDIFVCRKSASNIYRIDTGGHSHEPNSRKVSTAQFDKTANTTLADITGLTASLITGRTYRFRAVLFVNTDAVGGHKYAISLTSAPTSIIYQINSIDNTALAFKITSRQTSSGGAAGEASGTVYETIIEGSVVVNATATISVQFAQNAANGTSSVLIGSTLIVEDMGA
jgi:hypothetical protein